MRQFSVTPDVILQACDAIGANYEPQLQGAKAAAERNLPVAVVKPRTRFRGLVAQVFGKNTQSLNQSLAIGHVKAVAIEVGKHPLVRIERVTVGKFDPTMSIPKLRTQRSRSRHRSIDVKP